MGMLLQHWENSQEQQQQRSTGQSLAQGPSPSAGQVPPPAQHLLHHLAPPAARASWAETREAIGTPLLQLGCHLAGIQLTHTGTLAKNFS